MSGVVELVADYFYLHTKRAKDRKRTGRTSVRYGMKSETQGSVVFGNRKVAGSSSTVDNWCVVLYSALSQFNQLQWVPAYDGGRVNLRWTGVQFRESQ